MASPYATTADVDTGALGTGIELPRGINVQLELDRAAEEIDAVVGRFYQLPLNLSTTDPALRSYALMMKMTNVYLAQGNLIEKSAAGSEDGAIHARAKYFLNKAQRVLDAIEKGRLQIPQQQYVHTDTPDVKGPFAFGPDGQSRVEPFYAGGNEKPWYGTVPRVVSNPWA